VEVKLDSPVRECGCGIQKCIFGSWNVHSKFYGIVERVCHIDKIVEAFTTINPLHLVLFGVFAGEMLLSRSRRKNALVSSLNCRSLTSLEVGQKLRPIESSEISEPERVTLETFKIGHMLVLLSPAAAVPLRLKRRERVLLMLGEGRSTWFLWASFVLSGIPLRRNFFFCVFRRWDVSTIHN
jgi:hypothetical protein